jgi:hypothetical protein
MLERSVLLPAGKTLRDGRDKRSSCAIPAHSSTSGGYVRSSTRSTSSRRTRIWSSSTPGTNGPRGTTSSHAAVGDARTSRRPIAWSGVASTPALRSWMASDGPPFREVAVDQTFYAADVLLEDVDQATTHLRRHPHRARLVPTPCSPLHPSSGRSRKHRLQG